MHFRCVTGQRLLAEIAEENRGRLAHSTLRNVKTFLSAVFKHAKREGFLDGVNPMQDVSIPGGPPPRETHAYSLDEIETMLNQLPEPARTVVAIAAFTGLRKGELWGLTWQDYEGDELRVSRSVWNGHTTQPKTPESQKPVPLVPILAEMLEGHRKQQGDPQAGPIFRGGNGSPLNLDNLARCVIRPVLELAGLKWHGWHAFRRGLATNLNHLGIPAKTIQAILRHSNVATTMKHYVKSVDADARQAMDRLGSALPNLLSDLGVAARPN
jgi:integrase